MRSRIDSLWADAVAVAAAMLAVLAAAPEAQARPIELKKPASVEIGRIALGRAIDGHAVALVPVSYPIQMVNRSVHLDLALSDRPGHTADRLLRYVRLTAGSLRRPERRRRFVFVHRFDLWSRDGEDFDAGTRVRAKVRAPLDADGDGKAELRRGDQVTQPLSSDSRRKLCSNNSVARASSGEAIWVPLPACTRPVGWRVLDGPDHGTAWIAGKQLFYRSAKRYRGPDEVTLSGGQTVRFAVNGFRVAVRALGDSVTAGFGYYSNGTPMTIGHLLECRPGEKEFNDACSSNSLNTVSAAGKPSYASDYGLSNNVSWAAQWANANTITNYANFAISGSEPSDWAPDGEFHYLTERIESERPDYVLMTAGANPLLSEMLTGVDEMGCAVESDVTGGYRECIEAAFAEAHLREDLEKLYADLVEHTEATIYLMQYHLSVPSAALAYTATQIAEMGVLLNREIASVAAEVSPKRLQVIAPPHFNVGIEIAPVYPNGFSCSSLGYEVDGPSVQSTPSQDELAFFHPLSFCKGPAEGPPWVIGGDTGIHPSAAGYAQMASRVPPPG